MQRLVPSLRAPHTRVLVHFWPYRVMGGIYERPALHASIRARAAPRARIEWPRIRSQFRKFRNSIQGAQLSNAKMHDFRVSVTTHSEPGWLKKTIGEDIHLARISRICFPSACVHTPAIGIHMVQCVRMAGHAKRPWHYFNRPDPVDYLTEVILAHTTICAMYRWPIAW
jgi:hypothetical protein